MLGLLIALPVWTVVINEIGENGKPRRQIAIPQAQGQNIPSPAGTQCQVGEPMPFDSEGKKTIMRALNCETKGASWGILIQCPEDRSFNSKDSMHVLGSKGPMTIYTLECE